LKPLYPRDCAKRTKLEAFAPKAFGLGHDVNTPGTKRALYLCSGLLLLLVGSGFVLSALVSWKLSRKLGLIRDRSQTPGT